MSAGRAVLLRYSGHLVGSSNNKRFIQIKVKVQLIPEQAKNLQRLRRGVALPRPHYPLEQTQYPLYRRLNGPQGRLDMYGKSRPSGDPIPGPSSV